MPSNHTANYNLSQWVKSDQVRMDDFNADNAKIDAALAGLQSSKASSSALSSLQSTVSSHTASLAAKGNCTLYSTSYAGSGTASKSLAFPKPPQLVMVAGGNGYLLMLQGATVSPCALGNSLYMNNVTWSGNSVSWSYSGSGGSGGMMNNNGSTYCVLALLKAD